VEVHDILAEMAGAGVSRVALEASSHGLAQYRVDGVRLNAAAYRTRYEYDAVEISPV